ncbi:LysR substrate-binding domain-containing protein [Fulvivirga sedimenti]|uniref:LysR family transcriptional regulator n=1 Tax=Fulvivirga sedimenti TaxID=2879465 RepID=A0A9X1L2P9_9BACT|nr:LysR substrate-binding domain-containing protein [Fulvivirga sedimenti]MCA6078421.1 LysR family transcriptional regulator [Fulvivirga sedimenti]
MTIIQLEYIIAVDIYRHFGRAAESCHITQPTLSMQIQKLEDQLGVLIFDRAKTPVEPTDAGTRIIEQAKVVIHEMRKIQEMVSAERGEISGELTIGVIPTISPYLLPLFINQFLDKYPDVILHIEEMITSDVLRHLKSERIDIGLIVTPLEDSDYSVKPLYYEDFVGYVSNKNEYYGKNELDAKNLHTEELLLLNEGHCFRDQVLKICGDYKSTNRRFTYESGSLEALKKLVDKHGGMTLLPSLATVDMDPESSAKLRYFKAPVPVREVSLVTHKNFVKTGLARAIYNEILESIPPYLNIKKHGEVIRWK